MRPTPFTARRLAGVEHTRTSDAIRTFRVREELLADASINHSHIGWLTRTGKLIPDEDVLYVVPVAGRCTG